MEIDINEIKSLLKTMSAKEVTKKLDISRSKLYSIMNKNNISINEIRESQKPSDQTIIDLYKTNNLENAAKLAKTNKHYVIKVLKRNNIKRTFTKVDNLNITKVTEYFEDHTLSECGEKFGFSTDQIKWFLKKHNIDTTKHEGEPFIVIDDSELLNYFNQHNMAECAEKFKCSVGTIRNKLRALGADTSVHHKNPSENTRRKISESNKKRWNNNKYREKMAVHRSNMPKVSSIQKILYSILDDLNIKHFREHNNQQDDQETIFGPYNFDCVIPLKHKKLLIDCQGDYWHSLKKTSNNDRAKSTYIEKYHPDCEIKYLWEHEFKCKDKIVELIKYWTEKAKFDVVNFDFKNIDIRTCLAKDYKLLLSKYHYLPNAGRGGIAYGAYLDNELIAVCIFSPLIRQNLPHDPQTTRELSRLCIHPQYQKKNFASWFVSKCMKLLSPKYKTIISYCDTTFNHNGTVYRACNFKLDGEVKPDYWYADKNGWVMHKKTLYDHACSLKLSESDFANSKGYFKVYGMEKLKFIFCRT